MMEQVLMEKVFSVLEFDQVKDRLMAYAMSYLGRQQIEALKPATDKRLMEQWLAETEEALAVVATSSSVPIPSLDGVDAVMKAVHKGYVLTPDHFGQFATFLASAEQLRQYMARKAEIAPRVCSYALALTSLDDVRDEIVRCVHYGEVVDGASDELARIRKQIVVLEERIRRKIEAALSRYRDHLQETFHSQRAGRYVIPVKREAKRLVKGTILDESASGQTVYIEPEEVSIQQEELAATRFAEEREVSRILSVLTGCIAARENEIMRNLEIVGHYDFLFAKAKLAKSMNGRSVQLNAASRIRLRGARHPLIGQEAQPLDISLGGRFRTLVITGPNTGGKTVTLKTVGLFALMVQAGLLIPVEKDSEMAVFDTVLADIGDGQSINQSLSTFSAHVTNVIDILKHAGPKTLVLLDELAAGTDPGEGIGLAIAVLESLHRAGAMVLATTHFNEIKQFAEATPGFENARMEFDTETLRPLYRLKIGEAGESYALVIAEKLGVPVEIVERAKRIAVGKQQTHDTVGVYATHAAASQAPTDSAQRGVPMESAAQTSASEASVAESEVGGERDREGKVTYQKGDRVWIHKLRCSGIFVGPADDRGQVILMVKKQRMVINVKRIAPYVAREELLK